MSLAAAPPDDVLIRASERNHRSPDRKAIAAPPPPGLPSELLRRVEGPELVRAQTALSEVLQSLRSAEGDAATASTASNPTPEPEPSARLEAARAYVIGRAQHLSGDHAQAEMSLKQAAQLDPSSPEIWRCLAEAQEALGNRSASLSAYKKTLSLAPDDPGALEALSRAAAGRGEWEEAARLLARLRALDLKSIDSALPYLVSARLGSSLAALGYLAASFEAMQEALALPEMFRETTQHQIELAQLYRQRGELWRDAGDGLLKLGDTARAGDCYERAAQVVSLNPSALTPRRVYARMSRGHSADAAAILVDLLKRQQGRTDDRLLALLRYVALNSGIGRETAEAIRGYARSLPDAQRASAASSLARAEAACLPEAEAVRVLMAQVATTPADDASLRELLSRFDRSQPGPALHVVLDLLRVSPLYEERYARALVRVLGDDATDAGLAALPLESASSIEASLLRARLREIAGEYETADAELAALLANHPGDPGAPAAVLARTSILWKLGRSDEARALIATIDDSADPSVREAKVMALHEIGDYEAASALITPLLPSLDRATAADADRLLLSARLRMLTGEFVDAERLLQAVNLADPLRDEAYALLLNLYSRSGPLTSEAKAIATLRSLRENNPSSPTLRMLRAQEALQRGQLDIAERDLLDLAEEFPVRAGVVEALVRQWSNLGRQDHAETWLRERVASRADESIFVVQLALLLDARGRRTEAIALLDERLARMPGDDAASRTLEAWLTQDPTQKERAQALARARLARAPKTIDSLVELTEIAAQAGRYQEATETVERMRSSGREVRKDLSARLGRAVVEQALEALRGRTNMADMIALHHAVVEAAPDVPAGTYDVGIQLLARSKTPLNDIFDLIDRGSAQHPDRRTSFFSVGYDALIRPGAADFPGEQRIEDALALAQRACETTRPPPVVLHTVWVYQVWLNRQMRDVPSLARAVEIARDTNTIDALLDELSKGLKTPDGRTPDFGEIVYDMALHVNTLPEHGALVEWMYRQAIRLTPDHLWANNNLGYSLLEEDREIEEAARLIEVAYRQVQENPALNDRPPITDSMGWARYKQGVIADEVGPDGAVVREGALTLLRRAYEQAGIRPEFAPAMPVLSDHFADALWAAGERERAIELWGESVRRAAEVLAGPEGGGMSPKNRAEVELTSQRAQTKIDEARSDRAPPVSRIHGPAAPAAEPAGASGMIQ